MLDDHDLKIILELQKDARQSDTIVARRLGMNATTIRRKIARLIASGVFRIVAVTSLRKVGFLTEARIFIRADLQRVRSICEQLAAIAKVRSVATTAGRYDIIISVVCSSAKELSEFIQTDLASIPGILSSDTALTLTLKKQDHKIVPDDARATVDPAGQAQQKEIVNEHASTHKLYRPTDEIDDVDRDIIVELQRDARQSENSIAHSLGLSEATVHRRVRRLIREGIIVIAAVVHPDKVGYTTATHIGISTDPKTIDATLDGLAAMPNVQNVAFTAGQFDIVVWATFRSPDELSEFIRRDLSTVPGIVSFETFVNLEIKKLELGILQPRSERPLSISAK